MIISELWIRILLAAFASYRLAELIALDDGPYKIFKRFQQWTGKMAAGKKNLSFWPQLASLIICPFCVGIYTSILCGLLVIFQFEIGNIFLTVLAIAGIQTFLEQISGDRD
jgi:hypothetical protein